MICLLTNTIRARGQEWRSPAVRRGEGEMAPALLGQLDFCKKILSLRAFGHRHPSSGTGEKIAFADTNGRP